mgnify:CR=1 FL=1
MHVSDGNTRLIGLFASPIRHSSSPRMQNLAFLKCGINMQYLAFEVNEEHLQEAVNAIRILDMPGANISMPNKIRVIEYLDALSEEAYLIGAVNTIVNTDGRLTGYNTDCLGFEMMLKRNAIDVSGKKVLILGSGGASLAVKEAVTSLGGSAQRVSRSAKEEAISYEEMYERFSWIPEALSNTIEIMDKCKNVIFKEKQIERKY